VRHCAQRGVARLRTKFIAALVVGLRRLTIANRWVPNFPNGKFVRNITADPATQLRENATRIAGDPQQSTVSGSV
jgi:hypothetical protein